MTFLPSRALLRPLISATLLCACAAGVPAHASGTELIALVNAYRASPEPCNGRPVAAMGPLASHPSLSAVRIGSGMIVESALEAGGYAVEHAEAISISGSGKLDAVVLLMKQKYCATLLNPRFQTIGVLRRGDTWQVVLATPVPPLDLAPWPRAGQAMVAAVNRARAQARSCGERRFPAVAPLAWHDALGNAAFAHSGDMAANRFLRHQGSAGTLAGERASAAGYLWRTVGENIAVGYLSVDAVMEGWLSSPGHCANIMDARFTQMGAAYALADARTRVYWTQVFGTPR